MRAKCMRGMSRHFLRICSGTARFNWIRSDDCEARGHYHWRDQSGQRRALSCEPNVCAECHGISYAFVPGRQDSTGSDLTIVKHGVTIIGAINLASGVPYHASQMYARNVTAFLTHLFRDGKIQLDPI